jgi:putative acetyltransferase
MMKIRAATVEDAPLLWKAEVETAGTPGRLVSRPHELLLEAFEAKLRELGPRGCYVVAVDEEEISGAASLADLRKVELLVRDSNRDAIRLYQRLGFVEEGRFRDRVRLPDGTFVDDIAMAWFPPKRTG